MIDNNYIRLGMFDNNNVRLHFLCISHVMQILKMVRYSSETRITLTTFSCVMWHKNKIPIVIIKKIWTWAGHPKAGFLPPGIGVLPIGETIRVK